MKQDSELIFRAYDIRGNYSSQINEELAYRVGLAAVLFLKSKRIIVGRDCRNSSKDLSDSLIRGITDQGAIAIDIGLCSTPMVIFASKDCDAIMVTASHLPAHKNGFKIFKKGATPIGQENGLLKIKKMCENKFAPSKKKGEIQKEDYLNEYVAHVLKFAKNTKKLKIVVDAGNAMAGYILPSIFNNLPCEVVRLFFELNGNFPNRNPDPFELGATNALAELVKKQKADFGAAYDADCDRIIFVDEKGNIVSSDILLAILAQQLVGTKKENIVYELTCSKIVPETIKVLGSNPIICRTGHTFIQQMMQKKNALFGGERSGHYFYRDNFFGDSADITLMHVLCLLSKTNKKLSELSAQFKKYYSAQETFLTSNKFELIKEFEKLFSKQKMSKIDGVTVEFSDWWFNIRASNTESEIRLTVEAKNKLRFEEKIKELRTIVRKYCTPQQHL